MSCDGRFDAEMGDDRGVDHLQGRATSSSACAIAGPTISPTVSFSPMSYDSLRSVIRRRGGTSARSRIIGSGMTEVIGWDSVGCISE